VFSAGATVNKLVSTRHPMDRHRRWGDPLRHRQPEIDQADHGRRLPSQRVSTVAFDDQYVWFGTNKGLVRYRKTDRALKVYDESNGLPSKAVTYSVTIGGRCGSAPAPASPCYSPDVDGLRSFGEADGMASGDVAEVFQFGATCGAAPTWASRAFAFSSACSTTSP
jgi:hypothetical protein